MELSARNSNNMASSKRKRALISVADKTGLLPLAQQLDSLGFELVSTGGTATLLKQHGLPVIDVSHITGMAEMMGGRLKTLHPKIMGGILRRDGVDDEVVEQFEISTFDMVIVNFYPFENTIATPKCTFADAIENIDIGGPTMVRAAAKNHAAVTVVVDPEDYLMVISEFEAHQSILPETRFKLAAKAFARTCAYDAAIANYLNAESYTATFVQGKVLRYGENPHQKATFFRDPIVPSGCIASANFLQGKELSFNNIVDANAALECVKEFSTEQAGCVIVKHANPCGVALGSDLQNAFQSTFLTDPRSSFGSIIAFNQIVDTDTAEAVIHKPFIEVIIAPDITPSALEILKQKPNLRVLSCGRWPNSASTQLDYKRVEGGLLVQDQGQDVPTPTFQYVTDRQPTAAELLDLEFAWKVVKHVKSNAIVFAKNQATIGIGAGQMSRIMSAKIAELKALEAGLSCQGAVMASDAFFPFSDSIDIAATLGITTIIQPGGSIRDEEVIQAANAAGIAMVFTGRRHFRH